jgi:hypothetical protein
MKDIRNVQRGRIAKNRGSNFENSLHGETQRHGWLVVPIPDGCKQLSATKLIRVKSPFDFFFLKDRKALFVDAKTTKANTYSFSALTPHQINILVKIEMEGFKAGYIINFSELNLTAFFSGSMIGSLTKRSGLKPTDGILIGDNRIINVNRIFQDLRMIQSVDILDKQ